MSNRHIKALLRDLAAPLLYAAGVTRPGNPARLFVATFHRVLPAELRDRYPIPGIVVTPDELAWFAESFQRHFECGPLDRLHARWSSGARCDKPLLAVTFDDGQLDNFTQAWPVLKRTGLRATFFVTTDGLNKGTTLWHDRVAYAMAAWLEKDERAARAAAQLLGCSSDIPRAELPATFMRSLKPLEPGARQRWVERIEGHVDGPTRPGWDGMMATPELRELVEHGNEIGSHSKSHALLPGLDDAALRDEIVGSRALLERELSVEITSFCYPNGDADARVVQATRGAYRRAVTTQWGWNPRGVDPFRIKRCDIQSDTSRTSTGKLSHERLAWRMSGLFPGLG